MVGWERANSKAWEKSEWKRVAMFPNCIIVSGVRVKTGVHRQRVELGDVESAEPRR